jgi:cytochrome P450
VLQEQQGKKREWSSIESSHPIAELLTAGTETTATTLRWFFKAAVLNLDPLKRAQEEIDRVVDHKRLPTWEIRHGYHT